VAVAEEGTYDPKQLRELCLRHCYSIVLDQNTLLCCVKTKVELSNTAHETRTVKCGGT
jgi:hypothetical protein